MALKNNSLDVGNSLASRANSLPSAGLEGFQCSRKKKRKRERIRMRHPFCIAAAANLGSVSEVSEIGKSGARHEAACQDCRI